MGGEVTDVRVMKTRDGKARQFGFVGFRTAEAAERAQAIFNRSYIDTSRIAIETARRFGDDSLSRPWSRHSKGSSAYERAHMETPAPSGIAMGSAAIAKRGGGGKTPGASSTPLHSDPKLAEFLQLMAPKGKQVKVWNNDLIDGLGAGTKQQPHPDSARKRPPRPGSPFAVPRQGKSTQARTARHG